MSTKLHCILLVDDNFMTTMHNEMIIENLCLTEHVVAAENGNEALSFLKSNKKNHTQPELIIMDLNMPQMNGWEFLNQYEKLDFENGKPPAVVMLTSSHNPEDEKTARSYPGVIDFINKPLSEKAILGIFKKHFKSALPDE